MDKTVFSKTSINKLQKKEKVAVNRATFFIKLLLENAGVVVLPSIKANGLYIVGLNDVYHKSCNSKYDACDHGNLEKCVLSVSGFILTVISFRTTCDSAGKSIFASLLENNRYNNCYSGNK